MDERMDGLCTVNKSGVHFNYLCCLTLAVTIRVQVRLSRGQQLKLDQVRPLLNDYSNTRSMLCCTVWSELCTLTLSAVVRLSMPTFTSMGFSELNTDTFRAAEVHLCCLQIAIATQNKPLEEKGEFAPKRGFMNQVPSSQ